MTARYANIGEPLFNDLRKVLADVAGYCRGDALGDRAGHLLDLFNRMIPVERTAATVPVPIDLMTDIHRVVESAARGRRWVGEMAYFPGDVLDRLQRLHREAPTLQAEDKPGPWPLQDEHGQQLPMPTPADLLGAAIVAARDGEPDMSMAWSSAADAATAVARWQREEEAVRQHREQVAAARALFDHGDVPVPADAWGPPIGVFRASDTVVAGPVVRCPQCVHAGDDHYGQDAAAEVDPTHVGCAVIVKQTGRVDRRCGCAMSAEQVYRVNAGDPHVVKTVDDLLDGGRNAPAWLLEMLDAAAVSPILASATVEQLPAWVADRVAAVQIERPDKTRAAFDRKQLDAEEYAPAWVRVCVDAAALGERVDVDELDGPGNAPGWVLERIRLAREVDDVDERRNDPAPAEPSDDEQGRPDRCVGCTYLGSSRIASSAACPVHGVGTVIGDRETVTE